jgi:hypothetical protein
MSAANATFATSTSCSIFAPPAADYFAADLDREAAGHVGEIAHAHRHRQRVLFGA